MPQQIQSKPNVTFVKGLITERNELTFPADASTDELNCSLLRDGSRRRRLGVEFEPDSSYSTNTSAEGIAYQVFDWKDPANLSGSTYICIQKGTYVEFYEKGNPPISDTYKGRLNLNSFQRPGSVVGAGAERVLFTSIKGNLILTSSEIEPVRISYDTTSGSFSIEEVVITVRDFDWQSTKDDFGSPLLDLVEEYDRSSPFSSDSEKRRYDSRNSGWTDDALNEWASANPKTYPPLTLPWYAGKDSNNDFDVSEWEKIDSGKSLIANGRFLYDIRSIDRGSVAGITLPTETESTRPSCTATFFDRVFYSGFTSEKNISKVFFSMLVSDETEYGACYSRNDPTAEDFNDLLATDGGFFTLTGAGQVKRMHVWKDILFVFAENSVWSVRGVDGAFKATEYTINKISEVGIDSPHSLISAEGRPYWWGPTGIYTVNADEIGNVSAVNISRETIQTFWDGISSSAKDRVAGVYDSTNNKLFWFYEGGTSTAYKYNKVLILDEVLGAFYPWEISSTGASSPYIIGATYNSGTEEYSTEVNVLDSLDNAVLDAALNNVVVGSTARSTEEADIDFIVYDPSVSKTTFARATSIDFVDWGSANYSSYAVAGYDFMGEMTLKKSSPFITVYSKVTEEGFTLNGSDYDAIRPSGCKVSAYWDFRETPSTSAQEVYRLKRPVVVDPGDLATFGYPYSVVVSRLKTRGRGRVMQVRFDSVDGKDFHLLGWNVIGSRNEAF